jgi:hypothetical protein
VKPRPRIKHTATFAERLAAHAKLLNEQANAMRAGHDRDMVLRRVQQTEAAAHMNEWLAGDAAQLPALSPRRVLK